MSRRTVEIFNAGCQGCAQAVSGALAGIGGVRSADVDSDAKRAVVLYDPEQTDVDQLVAAIEGVERDPAPPFRVTCLAASGGRC